MNYWQSGDAVKRKSSYSSLRPAATRQSPAVSAPSRAHHKRVDSKSYFKSVSAIRIKFTVILVAVLSGCLLLACVAYFFSSAPVSANPPAPTALKSVKRQRQFIDTRSQPRLPVKHDRTNKYLAYFSHSGYHNQRIALENALTLAKLLGRTLLLPPIRFGPAVPYIWFDKLDFRINQANKLGLEHCKDFSGFGLLPRECMGYFDWTHVDWSLLIDVNHIQRTLKQPLVDRWNGTVEWLSESLDVSEKDIYAFKDLNLYNFRFYDSPDDHEGLEKFEKRVELSELKALDSYKLLHVGTLFGTSRLRTVDEYNWEVRSSFRQAMVFHNTLLDKIADTIRDRLGGPSMYVAAHVRIGDGIFLQEAKQNAALIFRQLLTKMKFPTDVIDELLAIHADSFDNGSPDIPRTRKRAIIPEIPPASKNASSPLVKRASNSRPQRAGAYRHEWPKPIPPIYSRKTSPLHSSMSCRGPLYTDRTSITLKLNTPLFLATDAAIPTFDPVLSLFFKAFPCTFVLSDFTSTSAINTIPVEELSEMETWYNAEDHVALAPFLYPIVDMMIAAKGYYIIGTPQSTFSRFAVDVLAQSYHGWPLIERG